MGCPPSSLSPPPLSHHIVGGMAGYGRPIDPPRLAAKCAFLRVTMGERAGGHLLNLCLHIVREGSECVGPFLDDHETGCGLWERKPQS